MTLTQYDTDPTPHPEPLCVLCWVSEGGRWIVRVVRVLFGFQVYVYCSDLPLVRQVNYCAGADAISAMTLAGLIRAILEQQPESITIAEYNRLGWPDQHYKPIYNDRDCWDSLTTMAGLSSDENEIFWNIIRGRADPTTIRSEEFKDPARRN